MTITRITFTPPNQPYEKGWIEKDATNDECLANMMAKGKTMLWKCWCMSMYWSMLSSTALVCIVDLTTIIDVICVCWNVTYVGELLP